MMLALELKRVPDRQQTAAEPQGADREIQLQAQSQGCGSGQVEHRGWASVSRRYNSFAFFHGEEAVDCWNRDFFLCPTWPVNLHHVDFHRSSEAEVQALIGTRCIASPAEHVRALPHASGRDKYLSSDRVAGALGASHQLQRDPVIRILDDVPQQSGRRIDVIENDVDVAVIEQVTEHRTSCRYN